MYCVQLDGNTDDGGIIWCDVFKRLWGWTPGFKNVWPEKTNFYDNTRYLGQYNPVLLTIDHIILFICVTLPRIVRKRFYQTEIYCVPTSERPLFINFICKTVCLHQYPFSLIQIFIWKGNREYWVLMAHFTVFRQTVI